MTRILAVSALALSAFVCANAAAGIDLASLWDHGNPALSEQRFRAALQTATGDDRIIVQTQIARTFVFRKQFAQARAVLADLAPTIAAAGPEARTRYYLELGRTFASGQHQSWDRTAETTTLARRNFEQALATAKAAQLDGLAVDAIHMFVFVDTAPADQFKWNLAALALVEASSQPAAKRWEATIRNNTGFALHTLGRYQEALDQFQQALALRRNNGNADAVRAAAWSVAWTLRALQETDAALAIQLRLEREAAAAAKPDPRIFQELKLLYQAKGQAERAAHYGALGQVHPQ